MAGEKVISLHGGPIPEHPNGDPDQRIVEIFETMLEDAKNGKITAVAFVTSSPEVTANRWYATDGTAEEWISMLGQVDMLHAAMRDWILCNMNRSSL